MLAIGIGHDVGRYYKHAVKITDVQDLGDVMIDQLTELFSNKRIKQYIKFYKTYLLKFFCEKSLIFNIKYLNGINIVKATINLTHRSPNANWTQPIPEL